MKRTEFIAIGVGVVLGAFLTSVFLAQSHNGGHHHDELHQITQPDEEYHVHADFLIYVNGEKLNLAQDEFMTTNQNELHEHAHLHDGNGEVMHLHESGVTFAEFLDSLSIMLTEDCLSVDGETYCTDEQAQLGLYVNYEPYNGNLTEYEPKDDDAVLLHYGASDPEQITAYMNEVKDDACYYSGTCPERGVAPPESCGLTCEL